MVTEKKKAEDKLSALHGDMEHELAVGRELKGELSRVQKKFKITLEEDTIKSEMKQQEKEFQSKLKKVHAEMEEAEGRADEEVEKLQEEVQLYKVIKYQQGYHDDALGKTLRYPFDDKEQSPTKKTSKVPVKECAL